MNRIDASNNGSPIRPISIPNANCTRCIMPHDEVLVEEADRLAGRRGGEPDDA